jgi:hypothetical protein
MSHSKDKFSNEVNSHQIHQHGVTNSIESLTITGFLPGIRLEGKGREMKVRPSPGLFPRSIDTIEKDPQNFWVELGFRFPCYDIDALVEG